MSYCDNHNWLNPCPECAWKKGKIDVYKLVDGGEWYK